MLFSALFVVSLSSGMGEEFYVDATSGNDCSDGRSPGAAWKTLTRAQNNIYLAPPTIYFKRGETWNESFTNTVNGSTLDAYGVGALPIFDGSGTSRRVISVIASNTVTRNIQLQNGGGGTGALWLSELGTNTLEDCILINHASDAIVAASADAHIIVRRCNLSGAFDDGVTLHSTSSALIENCVISNCFQGMNNSGTDMAMTVNNCVFQDNSVDIDWLGACPTTFNRCHFRGRTGAHWDILKPSEANITFNYCIFDAQKSTAPSVPKLAVGTTVTINNCVFYGAPAGTGTITCWPGTMNVNNCIFANWWRAAYIDGGGAFNADHCIFYNVAVKNITSNINEVSTSNPNFVDAVNENFRVLAGSAAINGGVNVGLTLDFSGATVSNPPEVGAYEFCAFSQ